MPVPSLKPFRIRKPFLKVTVKHINITIVVVEELKSHNIVFKFCCAMNKR